MQLVSNLKLVTGPTVEPISLSDAKLHLRVDHSADDSLISSLIVAARRLVEGRIRVACVSQTWDYVLDGLPLARMLWPDNGVARVDYTIQLPIAPVLSVSSIKWVDWSGVIQTLDPSAYQVATGNPGRVAPTPYEIWPWPRIGMEAVTIRFVAGYGSTAAAVPDTIKAAMKLLIGHWYEHPQAVVTGTIATQLPLAVESLIAAESWGNYA